MSDLPGEAIIDLALNGPISSVFEYISLEPISLGETIGIDPKKVAGSGDYKVNVTFPTSPDVSVDDVKVKVDATLRDTRLPGIVRGLDLTGGPLALKVDGGAFTISGKGLLDGAPIDLICSEYLDPANAPYASDIQAKLSATKKFVILLGSILMNLSKAIFLPKFIIRKSNRVMSRSMSNSISPG